METPLFQFQLISDIVLDLPLLASNLCGAFVCPVLFQCQVVDVQSPPTSCLGRSSPVKARAIWRLREKCVSSFVISALPLWYGVEINCPSRMTADRGSNQEDIDLPGTPQVPCSWGEGWTSCGWFVLNFSYRRKKGSSRC